MSLRALCNQDARLVTDAGTQNAQTGVYTVDYTATGTPIKVHLQPAASGRRLYANQMGIDFSHVMYYEKTTDIEENHRVNIVDEHDTVTEQYRIVAVEKPTRPGWPGKALVTRIAPQGVDLS